jgi:hypothetical protein
MRQQSRSTWSQYVLTLPSWEQDLLGSVHHVPDRTILLTALRTDVCLCLASYGGAHEKKASFGALVATSDTILAECGGCAQGADSGFFRAEGYGIMAVLQLLFHFQYFYVARNGSLRLYLYCDSQSLLTQLEVSRELLRTIPRCYLFSEVDVEMQILAALQTLEAPVTFTHVEVHHDTKYPDRSLLWAAQLNMQCDELANSHLEAATHPTLHFFRPVESPSPWETVPLHIIFRHNSGILWASQD